MLGSDFIQLDLGGIAPGRRTDRLSAELRAAIVDGRLAVGAGLPPTRVLATDLGCARGTVTEAYRRLTEEGLIAGHRGSGTVVVARPMAGTDERTPPGRTSAASVGGSVGDAGPTDVIDLSRSLPDLTAFPRAAWVRAERSVLQTATSADLGYAPAHGTVALRTELAAWLVRSRGVRCEPDELIITGGVTGALSLLAQVISHRGRAEIAVEDPSSIGNQSILSAWNCRLLGTPVDEHGIVVAELPSSAVAALVTPAHQYPTGVALSPERRRDLLGWANRVDGLVIEDDYDAEYRYDRRPVRALQGLDPARVAYTSSLSKTLAPGLRLGWLVAPETWRAELIELRWATDLGSPVVPQLVVAELLRNGVLERHLRGMRVRHRQRRDATAAAIGTYLPGLAISGIAAGLHLVLHLPDGTEDLVIEARARELGVLVKPLSSHYRDTGRPGLVINYAAHHPAELDRAIRLLATAVRAERRGPAGPANSRRTFQPTRSV